MVRPAPPKVRLPWPHRLGPRRSHRPVHDRCLAQIAKVASPRRWWQHIPACPSSERSRARLRNRGRRWCGTQAAQGRLAARQPHRVPLRALASLRRRPRSGRCRPRPKGLRVSRISDREFRFPRQRAVRPHSSTPSPPFRGRFLRRRQGSCFGSAAHPRAKLCRRSKGLFLS